MIPAITLADLTESQSSKVTTATNLWAALSHNALYGIKSVSGLAVTFYGGNINSSTPTPIASQTLTLDDNATVYVYSTSAGVFTKTTSIPSGWPGPLASSAVAMYSFVTADGYISSVTNYILGTATPGPTGAQGARGTASDTFGVTRTRSLYVVGSGTAVKNGTGFSAWTASSATGVLIVRSVSSASFRQSIPYAAYESNTAAGSRAQTFHPAALVYRGDSTNRGGFRAGFRFCFESANSPANCRCFIGLFAAISTIADVEPDTLTNLIGIGAKAGEANLSWLYNDGSGTATMTLIASDDSPTVNFPARATDNVYELVVQCDANASSISLTLTNCATGAHATLSTSSNIPANTTYLSPVFWVNNGSTAAMVSIGIMQAILESRY